MLPTALPFLTTSDLVATELATASMQPPEGTNGAALNVCGRATPNDGGHGLVVWEPESTVAPDNVFTFAPNVIVPGRWVRPTDGGRYLGYFGIRGANSGAANYAGWLMAKEWLHDVTRPDYAQRAILVGRPGDIYSSSSDWEITRSLVTIDLNNATWNSVARIHFNGDSGIDGDRSAALYSVRCVNGFIGTGLAGVAAKGPRFSWCDAALAANLVKSSPSGTAFNMAMCERSWFIDCINEHATAASATIGFLLHMCNNSGAKRCEVTGTGKFAIGFQSKGGRFNRLEQCDVHDIVDGAANGNGGFYVRGDAPYKVSSTSPRTYPWNTLGWNQVDERREARDTQVVGCRVWNCPTLNGLLHQESARTVVRHFWARGVRNGLRIIRATQAGAGFGHGFDGDDIDVEGSSRGIYINGPATGAVIDPETGEEETVGDGSFMENVTIRNFAAVSTGAGLEAVKVERCVAPSLSNGRGVSLTGVGIMLRNSNVDAELSNIEGESKAAMNGVQITSSNSRPRLVNVRGKNTSPLTVREVNCAAVPAQLDAGLGVRATSVGSAYVTLMSLVSAQTTAAGAAVPGGGNIGNGSVVSIQTNYGASSETVTLTATSPTEFDVVGSVSGALGVAIVGETFSGAMISFGIVAGGVAFAPGDTFTIVVSTTAASDVFRIEARIIGKETTGGGGFAQYHIVGLFRRVNEATSAQIGATQDVAPAIETDASWDGPGFTVAGAAVVLRVRAKDLVNVDWKSVATVELLPA